VRIRFPIVCLAVLTTVSLAQESPDKTASDKAAARGDQVITTDFVSHNDSLPGVGTSPQLMDAVFGEPDKSPPDVVQVPQGYVVFQLLAVRPPATPTFEEIRGRVEAEFKNQRAGILLQQKTQELADQAKAGHDLKKAAKELGATYRTSDPVAPDGQVPGIGSLAGPASAIFSLKQGEMSGPIVAGADGIVAELIERARYPAGDRSWTSDLTKPGLVIDLNRRLKPSTLAACFGSATPIGELVRGDLAAGGARYALVLVSAPRGPVLKTGCDGETRK